MKHVVFIDIETGGTDKTKHPVVEIAAAAVNLARREVVGVWHRYVLFHAQECDPAALDVIGWDSDAEKLWAQNGTSPRDAIQDLHEYLALYRERVRRSRTGRTFKTAMLAGHNAAAFDVPFLRAWTQRMMPSAFTPYDYLVLDTLQLAMWADPSRDSYKLGALAKAYGVPPEREHTAIDDVHTTIALWRALTRDPAAGAG